MKCAVASCNNYYATKPLKIIFFFEISFGFGHKSRGMNFIIIIITEVSHYSPI